MTTEEIYDGLYNKGIKLGSHVTGQIKTFCPECQETRKNKRDKSLSVDIDKGVWNCHHCGWSGMIKVKEEVYTVPEINNTELKDDSLHYFKKRGINQGTIKRWGITESQDTERWINFNYFENGKLVNVKYRGKDKKFKMSAGAKLVFYGIDLIKDNDWCVITEGEFDALAYYEANVLSVCSVPNGASKGNNNLKYLDNSWRYFENKEKIYIATDNDQPGRQLAKELIRRLGPDRCYDVDLEDCKDANEYLLKHGDFKLKETIKNAQPVPLEGISTVSDIEKDLDDLYANGYPKGATAGWPVFDQHLSFLGGQFTTVTGIPGHGKSEFIDQLALNLNEHNGWKFGVFSPENAPLHYHASKLCEKYMGRRFLGYEQMDMNQYLQAKTYVSENFYWVNFNNDDLSIDGILKKFSELIKRYGIKAGIVDPWNQLENKVPYGMTETQFISNALHEIMNFCLKYDFHLFLTAHPTKLKKEDSGEYSVPGLYDISGSAHFFNKTYNGFTVYRHIGTGDNDFLDDVTVYVSKVKFKWCGKIGNVKFRLNKHTTRYEEISL